MLRISRPLSSLIKTNTLKSSPSLLSALQCRFGGGGHISEKDRENTSGLGGPCPGVDYNENSDTNPFLWDPHYVPCEESDYERHHFFLMKEEKGRYAIDPLDQVRKLQSDQVLKRIDSVLRRMERAQTENRTIGHFTHLYNDLGLDSLDAVEFGLHLETEFEVELMDEEAEQITTIGDAVNLICDHPNAV